MNCRTPSYIRDFLVLLLLLGKAGSILYFPSFCYVGHCWVLITHIAHVFVIHLHQEVIADSEIQDLESSANDS